MTRQRLDRVGFSARQDYTLDVEVISIADLRKRASQQRLATPHRVDFHHLIALTEGGCSHLVDFLPMHCQAASWLLIQAGQVHAFDIVSRWQGWLVVFKPDALTTISEDDIFESLPVLLNLPPDEQSAAINSVLQLEKDARKYAGRPNANPLIRTGLHHLLLRLQALARDNPNLEETAGKVASDRFKRFKKMIDSQLHLKHHVHQYAKQLGCSEKSLNRSVLELSGVSAKKFLTQRIVLQAKRLLLHTSQPAGEIGLELGFDEPTNFIKFFKREAGMSPTTFRRLYVNPATRPAR